MDIFKQMYSEENVKRLGYFKYDYIKSIVDGFPESKLYAARQMWSLLSFEVWRSMFIEGDFKGKPRGFKKALTV